MIYYQEIKVLDRKSVKFHHRHVLTNLDMINFDTFFKLDQTLFSIQILNILPCSCQICRSSNRLFLSETLICGVLNIRTWCLVHMKTDAVSLRRPDL